MRALALINRDGGTMKTLDVDGFTRTLIDEFKMQGHTVEVSVCAGTEIREKLEAALQRDDIDVLLVGGGDGTVSTAAGLMREGPIALGILPAGTMNLFARTLQIPLDLYQAVHALASGTVVKVDYATVNGRPFVHQYALGLHARMVRMRERFDYGSRIGKIWATTRAVYATLRRLPRVAVEIDVDGQSRRLDCTAVAVSNNLYGAGHIPYADDPRGGTLGVYICTERRPVAIAKLTLDIMMGTWQDNPALQVMQAGRVDIQYTGKSRRGRAVLDGELESLEGETRVEIKPGGIAVLVPSEATYLTAEDRAETLER